MLRVPHAWTRGLGEALKLRVIQNALSKIIRAMRGELWNHGRGFPMGALLISCLTWVKNPWRSESANIPGKLSVEQHLLQVKRTGPRMYLGKETTPC